MGGGVEVGLETLKYLVYLLICYVFLLSDGTEIVRSLAGSKLSRKSGVKDKIEFLQHAEENYYRNKNSDKQVFAPPLFFVL